MRVHVLFSAARSAFGLAVFCLSSCGSPPTPPRPPSEPASPAPTTAPTASSAVGQPIADLLHTLRRPMMVRAYVTRGDPLLDGFVVHLEKTLQSFAEAGGERFRYELIDSRSRDARAAALGAGLKETAFGDSVRGYMGLAFRYGDAEDAIPILSPDRLDGIPYFLAMKVFEVRNKGDSIRYSIGVVAGKGEIALDEPNLIASDGKPGGPSMLSIIREALPHYEIVPVDLASGDQAVNPGLAGLILTQPQRDYNDAELQRIDDYVMRGRAIAVFAGAANMLRSDPTMTVTLDLHGIERLLDGYGIHLNRDVVVDSGAAMKVPVLSTGGQVSNLLVPGISCPGEAPNHPQGVRTLDDTATPFFRMEEVAIPYASSLVVDPGRQPYARLRVVARTTEYAVVSTHASVSMRPSEAVPRDPAGSQFAIAALVEGDISPAMPRAGGATRSQGRAGVFVTASGLFLANPLARAGIAPMTPAPTAPAGGQRGDDWLLALSQPYAQKYLTASILVFKNTLDWMVLGGLGVTPESGGLGDRAANAW